MFCIISGTFWIASYKYRLWDLNIPWQTGWSHAWNSSWATSCSHHAGSPLWSWTWWLPPERCWMGSRSWRRLCRSHPLFRRLSIGTKGGNWWISRKVPDDTCLAGRRTPISIFFESESILIAAVLNSTSEIDTPVRIVTKELTRQGRGVNKQKHIL